MMKIKDIFKPREKVETPGMKETPGMRVPLFAKIFYMIAIVSALLLGAFYLSPAFADFFNRRISSVYRAVLAHISGVLPFSIAEFFILMIPLILVGLTFFAVKKYSDSWRAVGTYCVTMLSFVALMFSVFTIGFAPGYRGTMLEDKLGMERKKVSAEELYDTAMALSEMINGEIKNIGFEKEGFSIMPYSFSDMNDKLLAAYGKCYDKYDFLQSLNSRIKPVMLSEPMSYTYITGVYTFFTGEANININEPEYTIPYTAAHELAHQRGIAREDEANFIAFLACLESDDAYIRYSGLVCMYEYVAIALYDANEDLYFEVRSTLPKTVRYEFSAANEFGQKYAGSVASNVSGTVNDTFLTMQGTEGTESYGLVVELAVAYHKVGKLS